MEEWIPPHPRRQPRLSGELTVQGVGLVFAGCVDYQTRLAAVGGDESLMATLIFLAGMVKLERVSDYLLTPLSRNLTLRGLAPAQARCRMETGGLTPLSAAVQTDLDGACAALIAGSTLLFLPGVPGCLSFDTGTEEKRAISTPENEVSVKGPGDCFVENLRTNTSLVRRHLRCPELKISEEIVGRQSLTPVDLLWVEGIADPELVRRLRDRLGELDMAALLSPGNIAEYLTRQADTPFPLLLYSERPDRFCRGLCEGRVGLLAEGLPLGYLAPGVLADFLRAPQDRAQHWLAASVLTALRWLCLMVTLILPGGYAAMVSFHHEMLPTRLALSIMASRQDVPFSALFETLVLLAAFEVLQEAGLRLPKAVGQTVSILGGLVVGSAAVEAKLISPAVLVVVAIAGIAGYTIPSQDLSAALRLWRFVLCILGGTAGLFGVSVGIVLLCGHLAGLDSLGTPYLTWEPPIRRPLPWDLYRPRFLRTGNRRKEG